MWPSGATLCCNVWVFHCGAFACCRAWDLGSWASVIVAHRLSNGDSWALRAQAQWLWHTGLASLRHVKSSQARDRNQCPLHWQVGSCPLYHQGSLNLFILFFHTKSSKSSVCLTLIPAHLSLNIHVSSDHLCLAAPVLAPQL